MKPLSILPASLMCLAAVTLTASAEDDGPGVSRIVSVEETRKLKAIRDRVGEIKGLEKLYEDRKQGHVIDDFAYFTEGFMEWLFGQKRQSGAKAPR